MAYQIKYDVPLKGNGIRGEIVQGGGSNKEGRISTPAGNYVFHRSNFEPSPGITALPQEEFDGLVSYLNRALGMDQITEQGIPKIAADNLGAYYAMVAQGLLWGQRALQNMGYPVHGGPSTLNAARSIARWIYRYDRPMFDALLAASKKWQSDVLGGVAQGASLAGLMAAWSQASATQTAAIGQQLAERAEVYALAPQTAQTGDVLTTGLTGEGMSPRTMALFAVALVAAWWVWMRPRKRRR